MRTSFLASVFASTSLLLLACSGSSGSEVLGPGGTAPASSSTTTEKDPSTPTPKNPGDPKTDDPEDDPKPVAGPPATAADCDAFAATFCTRAGACNHIVSTLVGAACTERISNICQAHIVAPGTGFTKTSLTACASAYSTLTCAQAFGDVAPAACDFKGSLPLNAECAFDDQCASGSCGGNDDNECGTCSPKTSTPPSVPKADLGEACDNSGQSAPQCNTQFGLWCDANTNKCAPIPTVAIGQPCGYIDESIVLCAAGGTCKTGSAGTGTCVAEKAIGSACNASSSYQECTFGTECIGGKCAYPTAAAICQ